MHAQRRLRLPLLSLVVCLALPVGAPSAHADESPAANVAAARRHYDKARAFYEQGAYREAIGELDAAHALDPNAKDLVFNLGVVHEKLGDIDDALQWFRLYATMKLTPQESDRAEAYVRRLEGAKKQRDQDTPHPPPPAPMPAPESSATPDTQAPAAPPVAPPPPPPPAHPASPSRFDALTLTTGGIAAVGLVTGTVLGIKAIADQPGSSFVTGRDGSYGDLVQQVDAAHAEAVAADVALGIGAVAAVACAYFYWGRPHAAPTVGVTTISATPLRSGVAFSVGGTL